MRQLLIEIFGEYKVVTEDELREIEEHNLKFDGFHAHRVVGYCDELKPKSEEI